MIEKLLRDLLADQFTDAANAVSYPAPQEFSRADQADLMRVAQLWIEWHGNVDLITPKRPYRPCPACGSIDHRLRFPTYDRYPVHSCTQCATFFIPYLLEEDFVEEFWAAVPEAGMIAARMMTGREGLTRDLDRSRFSDYFNLVKQFLPAFAETSYLDIGCGVGHSVEIAGEHGFTATGLEVNRAALRTAADHGRNVVHPDDWSSREPMVLVTLFETLEHVADPLAMLQLARDHLADRGLLMVTIPSGQSWEVLLDRDRCLHVYGGTEGIGHINLFSLEGLKTILSRAGFTPLLIDGQYSSNIQRSISRLLDQNPPAPDIFLTSHFVLPKRIEQLLALNWAEIAAIERAALRSPILIAIACRNEDAAFHAERAKKAQLERRAQIERGIRTFREHGEQLGSHAMVKSHAGTDTSQQMQVKLGAGDSTNLGFVGMAVQSVNPVRFERLATLGSFNLEPGHYDVAVSVVVSAGAVSIGLMDRLSGTWIATVGADKSELVQHIPVAVDRLTPCLLVLTGNNSDGAEYTAAQVFQVECHKRS